MEYNTSTSEENVSNRPICPVEFASSESAKRKLNIYLYCFKLKFYVRRIGHRSTFI